MAVRYIAHRETHRETQRPQQSTTEQTPCPQREKKQFFRAQRNGAGQQKKERYKRTAQDALSSLTSTSIAQVAQALHKHRAEKRT